MAQLSDTAPTLAVVAAFADSPTRVTGIGFIREKETDRIGAVVAELRRLGVEADEEADGFVVRPGPMRAATVQTYDDHRMAMSFALAGLRVPASRSPTPAASGRRSRATGISSTSCGARRPTALWSGPHEDHRDRRPGGLGQVHRGAGAGGSARTSSTWTPARCTARSPSPPFAAASIRRRPNRSLGSSTDIELEIRPDGVTGRWRRRHDRDPRARGQPGREHRGGQPGGSGGDGSPATGVGGGARRGRARGSRHRHASSSRTPISRCT